MPEIQDLLLASAGANLGVDFLPGALPFRPPAGPAPAPAAAADVVWFDALVTNVDRHREQHEPAPLARPALADRPRRRALLPPWRRATSAEHARAAVRGDRRARAAAVRGLDRRGRRAASPGRHARAARRDRRRGPGRLARRRDGRGLRRLPAGRGSPRRAPSSRRRSRLVSASNPFSYAVYHLVPRVERGERINVGVIVFCRPLGYLGARTTSTRRGSPRSRRTSTRGRCEPHLVAIERIAAGDPGAGPIARLEVDAALPLARRAVEHDHPAFGRPHRALRRPGASSSSGCSASSCSSRRPAERGRLSGFAGRTGLRLPEWPFATLPPTRRCGATSGCSATARPRARRAGGRGAARARGAGARARARGGAGETGGGRRAARGGRAASSWSGRRASCARSRSTSSWRTSPSSITGCGAGARTSTRAACRASRSRTRSPGSSRRASRADGLAAAVPGLGRARPHRAPDGGDAARHPPRPPAARGAAARAGRPGCRPRPGSGCDATWRRR